MEAAPVRRRNRNGTAPPDHLAERGPRHALDDEEVQSHRRREQPGLQQHAHIHPEPDRIVAGRLDGGEDERQHDDHQREILEDGPQDEVHEGDDDQQDDREPNERAKSFMRLGTP